MSTDAIGFIWASSMIPMGVFGVWLLSLDAKWRWSCPSRKDAVGYFMLGGVFGIPLTALAIVTAPIWFPCMIFAVFYDGSKVDRAVRAWWNAPLCHRPNPKASTEEK